MLKERRIGDGTFLVNSPFRLSEIPDNVLIWPNSWIILNSIKKNLLKTQWNNWIDIISIPKPFTSNWVELDCFPASFINWIQTVKWVDYLTNLLNIQDLVKKIRFEIEWVNYPEHIKNYVNGLSIDTVLQNLIQVFQIPLKKYKITNPIEVITKLVETKSFLISIQNQHAVCILLSNKLWAEEFAIMIDSSWGNVKYINANKVLSLIINNKNVIDHNCMFLFELDW